MAILLVTTAFDESVVVIAFNAKFRPHNKPYPLGFLVRVSNWPCNHTRYIHPSCLLTPTPKTSHTKEEEKEKKRNGESKYSCTNKFFSSPQQAARKRGEKRTSMCCGPALLLLQQHKRYFSPPVGFRQMINLKPEKPHTSVPNKSDENKVPCAAAPQL